MFGILTAPIVFVIGLVDTLWSKFTGFVSGLNLVENGIGIIAGVFDILTSPIRTAIGLIDSFLSKFDIYNKAKAKIMAIGESVSDGVDEALEVAKSWAGLGGKVEAQKSSVDNTVKNHTVVDVNVMAVGGAKAETSAKGTGGIKLRTVENGIGGA